MLKFKNKYFWVFIVTLLVSITLYLFAKQWKVKQLPFNEFISVMSKNVIGEFAFVILEFNSNGITKIINLLILNMKMQSWHLIATVIL